MKKLSKKYAASLKLVDKTKKYTIAEACDLVKKTATAKCDESIDVSFRLNIDPKQADQQLRGTITLPHGNGKTKKILGEKGTPLIDELLTLEDPYHCPHGRPTIISISRQELEKKFKRIV